MSVVGSVRPTSAIGPLGEVLTLDSLPDPTTTRWVVRRKAEVVAAVNGGLLTTEEACERYALILEELVSWQRAIDRVGFHGLRTTRSQLSRGLRTSAAVLRSSALRAEKHWLSASIGPPNAAFCRCRNILFTLKADESCRSLAASDPGQRAPRSPRHFPTELAGGFREQSRLRLKKQPVVHFHFTPFVWDSQTPPAPPGAVQNGNACCMATIATAQVMRLSGKPTRTKSI